ncbi:hypothetical protein TRVL_08170 [Trypanosoma vivax]|nr:hypothetical protein TRVL_08170 [Trypanosoma vivax]
MRSLPSIIHFVGCASFFLNFCAVTPPPLLEQLRVGVLHVHDLPPHVFGEISPVPERTPQNVLQFDQLARLGVVTASLCCLQQDNGLWLMGIATMCCGPRRSLT